MASYVYIKGLNELMKKLTVNLTAAITSAQIAVGELVRTELVTPPGPVHKPIEWASVKQRRFVMALARARGGPYVRESSSTSQRLLASWTVAKQGPSVVVGTRVSYAPFVQKEGIQQKMHANTGWVTDKAALARVRSSGYVKRIYRDAIRHALKVA